MIKTWGLACALVLGSGAFASADDKPGTGTREEAYSDAMFVEKAAIGGMCEVKVSKLAETNAQHPEVKKFAERMIADHTKANEKLMAIAKSANIQLPTAMPEEKQKMLEKMQTLRGTEFDREYMTHAVKSHEKSVELFTKASEKAQNAELKAFATQTLPTIKEHFEMAKKLHGVTSGTGSGE